jgi:hypothetical protein
MPLDLKCWSCGEIFYETNDHDGYFDPDRGTEGGGHGQIQNPRVRAYREDVPPNGAMFRMKEPYSTWGWEGFPHDEAVIGDALECAGCGTPYSALDGGKLQLLRQPTTKQLKPKRKAA